MLACSNVTQVPLRSPGLVFIGSKLRGVRAWPCMAADSGLLIALPPVATPLNGPVILANQFLHGIPYLPGAYR